MKTLLRDAPEAALGRGFKYAYVAFERPSSVASAMTKMSADSVRTLVVSAEASSSEEAVGLAKWRREYNQGVVHNVDKLMEQIEAGVARIDAVKDQARTRDHVDE